MKNVVLCGDREVNFEINFSHRRKTIAILIYRTGQVEVKAPFNTPVSYIRELVAKKGAWIGKRISHIEQVSQPEKNRTYCNGDPFLFLGNTYVQRIIIGNGYAGVRLNSGISELHVHIPDGTPGAGLDSLVRQLVLDWYTEEARRLIGEKINTFSGIFGVEPPSFRVKNMRTRWGSCSSKNNLNFNIKLVMAPEPLIDYVVLHELCHIRHKDHSAKFWKALGLVLPDYPARRKELKNEGFRYVL